MKFACSRCGGFNKLHIFRIAFNKNKLTCKYCGYSIDLKSIGCLIVIINVMTYSYIHSQFIKSYLLHEIPSSLISFIVSMIFAIIFYSIFAPLLTILYCFVNNKINRWIIKRKTVKTVRKQSSFYVNFN